MFIDKIKVCDPIEKFLVDLQDLGFSIIEKKLRDYHFNELYIKLTGDLLLVPPNYLYDLEKYGNQYTCKCHWSTVEIISNDEL